MADLEKVKIKKVLQLGFVVRDLQKSMKIYWEVFGIGPWHIITFQPPALKNTTLHGKPEAYTMKLAIAHAGNIEWELIQPLTGKSIYQEFLDEHGEGLHHIACDVGDYNQAVDLMKKHGIGTMMTGQMPTDSFAYMDTEKTMGTVMEIYNRPADFNPPPSKETYPPSV